MKPIVDPFSPSDPGMVRRGLLLTFPGVTYLTALDRMAKLDASAPEMVLLVVGFCLIQQLLLEVPLLGYAFAPETTQDRVTRFRAWLGRNGRRAGVGLAATIGTLLVIRGVVTLLILELADARQVLVERFAFLRVLVDLVVAQQAPGDMAPDDVAVLVDPLPLGRVEVVGAADADRLLPGEALEDDLVGADLQAGVGEALQPRLQLVLALDSVPQELSPGKRNRTSSASIFSVGPMSPALARAMLRAIIFLASHDSIAASSARCRAELSARSRPGRRAAAAPRGSWPTSRTLGW